jgi:hypothetical protein
MKSFTKEDVPDYAPAEIELPDGSTARVSVLPDDTLGAPWEEHDGHGVVSEWTRRDKAPGELVLCEDRGKRRFYDFSESVKIARRHGWGAEGRTPRERAALAALADFRRLRGWCNDDWSWCGVVVDVIRPDGSLVSDSLWGIESDGDYWREVAAELLNGLQELDS